MAILEDLPPEVLDKIFSRLDQESIFAASNVCISWRVKIHDFMTPSKCDQELKDKLEKCGWIMSEHNIEKCKCIELKSSLFKYIGNVSQSYKEVHGSYRCIYDYYGRMEFAISKSKLCIASDGGHSHTMSVIDLVQDHSETVELSMYMEEHEFFFERAIWMKGFGNTLALLESYHDDYLGEDDDDYEEKLFISNTRKIHLWNLNTFEHVSELNISDQAIHDVFEDYSEDELRFEIGIDSIVMSDANLAVNLTIEPQNRNIYQTQIWNLDTSNPSNENISYWTTIKPGRIESEFSEKRVYMNSKFLCKTVTNYTSEEYKLQIFNFDDLSGYSTKVFGKFVSGKEIRKSYAILLEPGASNKIAIFDRKQNIINIYKLDGDEQIQVQLLEMAVDESLTHKVSNFINGKIVLLWANDREYQFTIVTEDGYVVNGNKQQFRHYVDKYAWFEVADNGMVVLTDAAVESTEEKFYLYHS